jgi:signal transduction histidine kinase
MNLLVVGLSHRSAALATLERVAVSCTDVGKVLLHLVERPHRRGRRLERDLHDGAQQRLVALQLELRAAEECVPAELQPLKEQISGLMTIAAGVSAEVQMERSPVTGSGW